MGHANLCPKMSSAEGYRSELRLKSKRNMQRYLRVSITNECARSYELRRAEAKASKEIAGSRLRLHASYKTTKCRIEEVAGSRLGPHVPCKTTKCRIEEVARSRLGPHVPCKTAKCRIEEVARRRLRLHVPCKTANAALKKLPFKYFTLLRTLHYTAKSVVNISLLR